MKNLRNVNFRTNFLLLVLVALICTAGSLTSFASAPPLTISVVNNSNWEIRHLYLSSANNDNWGADQLGGSSIGHGATRTLNVSWEESTVKLIAEDQDGCFLTTTVEASGNPAWTITADTPRNCGD
jgi:hypothetical protein